MDGNLTYTPIPDQSGPGSNANEVVLHISRTSRTVASLSDAIKWTRNQDPFFGESLTLQQRIKSAYAEPHRQNESIFLFLKI